MTEIITLTSDLNGASRIEFQIEKLAVVVTATSGKVKENGKPFTVHLYVKKEKFAWFLKTIQEAIEIENASH